MSLQKIVFPYVTVDSVTDLLLTTPPKTMVKVMDDRSLPVNKRIPLLVCARSETIQYLLIKGSHLLAALLNTSQESLFCFCHLIVVPASRLARGRLRLLGCGCGRLDTLINAVIRFISEVRGDRCGC